MRRGESRGEEEEKEKKTNPPVVFHMNPVGSHKGRLFHNERKEETH